MFIVFTESGDVFYVSENVKAFFGYSQVRKNFCVVETGDFDEEKAVSRFSVLLAGLAVQWTHWSRSMLRCDVSVLIPRQTYLIHQEFEKFVHPEDKTGFQRCLQRPEQVRTIITVDTQPWVGEQKSLVSGHAPWGERKWMEGEGRRGFIIYCQVVYCTLK